MRKISLDELVPGMKLAKDIILDDGRLLLLKGFTIKNRYLEKLRLYNIPYVFVEDDIDSVEHYSEETVYTQTFQTIKNVMESVRSGGDVDYPVLKEMVNAIVHKILNDDNIFMKLTGIRDIDNYTYLHSVDVCIYSIICGKSINLPYDEIKELGLGAILHDIGKCRIPLDILNKPSKLAKHEYDIIKKHTIYGHKIVSEIPNVSKKIAMVVLNHHEHWDGSGYPGGKSGNDIDMFSQIVAIADVYDALTANRVYRKRFMPHDAAEYIMANSAQHFAPDILHVFLDNIAVYPEDIIVLLNTGEIGRVVESKGKASIRPKIKVITRKDGPPVLEPYEVDLMKNTTTFIVDILS
jgi:HD-GYP domain-containing protein (c-di-GMP phosphodiesterase class II)